MAKTLLVALIFALLIGLSPTSNHMSAMRIMQMDEMMTSPQTNMADRDNPGENSTGTCCDFIATFSVHCVFLVPQSFCADRSGGSQQVVHPALLFQSIYIQSIAPPPKA